MRLVTAAALLLLATAPAPELRYFRYQRTLKNLPQKSTQACLTVDATTYAHSAPELTDLRLYRGAIETPYEIQQTKTIEVTEKSIAPMNLGVRDGHTVFDANLNQEFYRDIELGIEAKDFIATVNVSGTREHGGNSETKLGSFTIFDLTGQKLGRSTVLHLPPSDFPYLHFSIVGPLHPQNITGLSVVRLPENSPVYETVAQSTQVTQKDHASVLELTVPAHVPVDRIVFQPPSEPANFSRNVTITAAPTNPPTEEAEPQPPAVIGGNLLRIHTVQNRNQHIDEERLAIDISDPALVDSSSPIRWTIRIENGDDAPLQLPSVQLQMLARSFCFESDPGASYALYYGDPALAAPHYDYGALFTPQPDAAILAVGPEQQNPIYQPRPDNRPFSEKYPALLWVTLVIVIALLGWVALRSFRRTAPKPQS